MMTEQRKRRLKQKIQHARERLMESDPFFALLLMYLKFVAVPEMKKMSTNGQCIYFSPDFVDKLYEHELDFVLCHQIMHIIYGHIFRPFDLAGDDYHFACDILVNANLCSYDFASSRFSHLGDIHYKIPGQDINPAEKTAEEIYGLLPYNIYMFDERTRSRFLIDNDLMWDKDATEISGEIIIDIPKQSSILRDGLIIESFCEGDLTDGGCGSDDGLKEEWKGRVALVAKSILSEDTNSIGAGNVPEFVKRMIEKMGKPSIDWKNILNNFLQECICDYSFSPPDRRFLDTGFFLPDFNEKDFVSKEILFMVDTSGSVNDEDLAKVYSEIKGAIEQFGGKLTGRLGFFDADVIPPIPFDSISDLMRIIPYGGGGTDFTVIFDYIRNNYNNELPSCVVIFTDGYGPYPAETETRGIPILWIINNLRITPPFGRTVRLLQDLAKG